MKTLRITEFYKNKDINESFTAIDSCGIKRQIDEVIVKELSKTGKTVCCLLRQNNINMIHKNYRVSYLSGNMYITVGENKHSYLVGKYEEVN